MELQLFVQLFIVLFIIFQGSQCLKSLVIKVPEYVRVNETVTLACDYDLEDVALYTIKWYWNGIEFYRFVPKESPPSKAFSIPNFTINVDISKSGANEVTLLNVQSELSGLFKCEVSADAPLFHTELKGAVMNIIGIPAGGVQMEAEPRKVEIGKKIKGVCSIEATKPSVNLTWYINNQMVGSGRMHELNVQIRGKAFADKVESHIEILAVKSYFTFGPMVLKCDASLYNIWNSFTEAFIFEEIPFLAPVLLSTSSQTHNEDNFDYFGANAGCSTIANKFNLLMFCCMAYVYVR